MVPPRNHSNFLSSHYIVHSSYMPIISLFLKKQQHIEQDKYLQTFSPSLKPALATLSNSNTYLPAVY